MKVLWMNSNPANANPTIDFQRKFRGRLCRLVYFPELFTVARHEHRDFTRRLGKMQQRPVHFLLQVRELGEIFQMGRLLSHFLPQVLNRVEVG